MIFDFYVWNSFEMINVTHYQGSAHSKRHFGEDVPIVAVSVTEAADGVLELPNVEMAEAVLRDAPAELDVILTESNQSSKSVFEKGCI